MSKAIQNMMIKKTLKISKKLFKVRKLDPSLVLINHVLAINRRKAIKMICFLHRFVKIIQFPTLDCFPFQDKIILKLRCPSAFRLAYLTNLTTNSKVFYRNKRITKKNISISKLNLKFWQNIKHQSKICKLRMMLMIN